MVINGFVELHRLALNMGNDFLLRPMRISPAATCESAMCRSADAE